MSDNGQSLTENTSRPGGIFYTRKVATCISTTGTQRCRSLQPAYTPLLKSKILIVVQHDIVLSEFSPAGKPEGRQMERLLLFTPPKKKQPQKNPTTTTKNKTKQKQQQKIGPSGSQKCRSDEDHVIMVSNLRQGLSTQKIICHIIHHPARISDNHAFLLTTCRPMELESCRSLIPSVRKPRNKDGGHHCFPH